MVRLLAVLVLVGITSHECFSQVWVEDYQYNGTELDSSKWTFSSMFEPPTLTFNGSSMNVTMPTANSSVARTSFIRWHQFLPLNQSWSVVQRFKSNPIQPRVSWMYAGGVVNLSNGVSPFYLSDGMLNSVGGYSTSGGVSGMISNLIDDSYYWMGVSHDSASKSLVNIFSFTSTSTLPDNSAFQILGDSVSTAGSENFSFRPTISWGFIDKGSYELTDFKIVPYSVPEPSSLSLLLAGGAVALARRRKS